MLESFLLANADSIEKKNGVLPLDGGRRDFPGNRIDCQFEQRSAQTLGLVTQTLLVTVLTHALAALMLVDFCFTAFFERSHDCGSFVVLLW